MGQSLVGLRLLLTGASSGIGHALADAAVRRGARVALVARHPDRLADVARQLLARSDQVLVAPADLISAEDRRRLLDTVTNKWQGLDVLINNAGVGSFGHFSSSTEAN